MTLHITLYTDESEDFSLKLKIDANSSFGDLHRLILNCCGYEEKTGQRFIICDRNWKPRTRILLSDEHNLNIDEDTFLMDDTDLGDFLEDEGQQFAYRFDPENRRIFLMFVSETSFGTPVAKDGELTCMKGIPPEQNVSKEELTQDIHTEASEDLGEEFYGNDGFNEDDFDEEGFDILNE